MNAVTDKNHHFTCLSEMERDIWEARRRELQPRLTDYLSAGPLRFFPPRTLVCPKCGGTGYLVRETFWVCSHCGAGGDILDSAVYATSSLDYAENIKHIETVLANPPKLRAYKASALMDVAFLPNEPLVEGVLYPGLYLLAGAPKVGKSWLVLYLAQQISRGEPLWGLKTTRSEVLYFCLEDTFQRLQERMNLVCGGSPGDIYLALECNSLGQGLEEQIESFAQSRENGRLVIIDTLQKVRPVSGDQYSYSKDYETMTQLKKLADRLEITILVVHHTRKQEAADSFDKISGTQGLMGCADGALVLEKKARAEGKATLKVTGRQSPDLELGLTLQKDTMHWEPEEEQIQVLEKRKDPLLEALSDFLLDFGPFEGTASQLCERLKSDQLDLEPRTLGRRLNGSVSTMLHEYHICYETYRTMQARILHLELLKPSEEAPKP